VEWVDFCRVNCVLPGFVDTNIMAYASKKMREKWLELVPGRRFSSSFEMKGVCFLSPYLTCTTWTDGMLEPTSSEITV
jgi:NAD(P)-dependent dehydrogenase (short-subunit alcohol dehydrogenase family)